MNNTTQTAARGVSGTVIALIGVISVFALTQGVTYPLLSLRLEAAGYSADMIGLSGAMTPLGIVLAGPFIPKLMRHFNMAAALCLCIVITIFSMAAMSLIQHYYAWLLFRFVLGVAVSGLYIIGESGLQKVVPDHARGRMLGLYNGMMVLGYAAGPALLSLIGTDGMKPFIVSMVVVALTAIPLVTMADDLPQLDDDEEEHGFRRILTFAGRAPALLLACAAVALFDHVSTSLLPIYGMAHGLANTAAIQLATATLLGAMVGQFFIGWLADRLGIGILMVACGAIVVGVCGTLAQVVSVPQVSWPLCFLWGAAAFGPFTLALTELGRRFTGQMMVVGNVAMGMTWGMSQATGSPLAGMAMNSLGPVGLTLVIGGLFGFLALVYAAKTTIAATESNGAGAAEYQRSKSN